MAFFDKPSTVTSPPNRNVSKACDRRTSKRWCRFEPLNLKYGIKKIWPLKKVNRSYRNFIMYFKNVMHAEILHFLVLGAPWWPKSMKFTKIQLVMYKTHANNLQRRLPRVGQREDSFIEYLPTRESVRRVNFWSLLDFLPSFNW